MPFSFNFRNQLHDAFVTAIGTAWPEVVANGVYRSKQIARQPFEKKVSAGALPLVVIDYDLREGDWGAANATEEGLVAIHYITTLSTSDDALMDKLEALCAELWNNGLTTGQILGNPVPNDSLNLPVNQHFAFRQNPLQAGAVLCRVVVGETP